MAFIRKKEVYGRSYYSIVEGQKHVLHLGAVQPTREDVFALSESLGFRIDPHGVHVDYKTKSRRYSQSSVLELKGRLRRHVKSGV